MPTLTTQAIVLRTVNYRESDRILTLFSPEHGKLTASARGARKGTSKLLAASQLFCCGEYMLREIKGHYNIGECQVEDAFFELSADLDSFAYASFLVSVCEAMAHEGEAQQALYVLLRRSLSYLCYGKHDPRAVTTVFMFKMLHITGYQPKVDACVHCGAKEALSYFDTREGGVACARCAAMGTGLLRLSGAALYALRFYQKHDTFEELLLLKLTPAAARETENLLQAFLTARLERPFRSAQFLDKLRELYQG